MSLAQRLDTALLNVFGTRHFRLTRDPTIADRAAYMRHYVKQRPGGRILDVGCGSAANLLFLAEAGCDVREYVGIDRDVAGLAERFSRCRLPHRFLTVDLNSDWSLGRFDLVCCFEVIEHLVDDESLFARLAASVAPGGLLLLTTPSAPYVEAMARHHPGFDNTSPLENGDHVRTGYTAAHLRGLGSRHGMQVRSIDFLSRYDSDQLGRLLAARGIAGRAAANLREARRDRTDMFVIGGEPAALEQAYWSLGAAYAPA